MQHNLYCIFLLGGCLFWQTAGASMKTTIKWKDDAPKVKVKAVGLFSKTPEPKLHAGQDAPSGSLARELALDNYRFEWRPRWNFTGLGGMLLPFILESLDESVLGIVESLPQKDAPTSSIVVFMNLYNLRVINYLLMPGDDVRKFCFVPFSGSVVCLIKSPYNKYDNEDKFRLQLMDTHNGEAVSVSPIFKELPAALCCSGDGRRLFVAFKNSDQLRIYDLEDLSKAFETFKTVNDPVALCRSTDGKRLAVAGSGEVQIINTEQHPIPEKTIKLPEFYNPDKMVLCSKNASTFLLSCFGKESYFYDGKEFVKLCKLSDNDVNWSVAEQRMLVGIPLKSTICIYNPRDPEKPEMEFRYNKLRPYSSGKLHRIISLPGRGAGILVIDKLGEFSRAYRKRQRWLKDVIIEKPRPQ